MAQHGDGGAGDAHAILDGTDAGTHESRPAHRLVHRRDTVHAQRVDGRRVRAGDVGDDDGGHGIRPSTRASRAPLTVPRLAGETSQMSRIGPKPRHS